MRVGHTGAMEDASRSRLVTYWDLLPLLGLLAFYWIFTGLGSHLPVRVPTHWGAAGIDRWQSPERFFLEALALTACTWLVLWIVSAALHLCAREEAAPVLRVLEPIRGLIPTGLFGLYACLLLNAAQGQSWLGLGTGCVVACTLGGVLLALRRLPRAVLDDRGEAGRSWHLGVFYARREDPRILVPRRWGRGWTLNFAHGRAWGILAVGLLLPLAVALMVLLWH